MPLEIRELHIKVNVGGAAGGGGGEGGTSAPAPKSAKEQGEDKDRLVAQCVDEVMQVLKDRKER